MSNENFAIRAEGLGKHYLIGHQSASRERYTALRDVLAHTARHFARKAWDTARGRSLTQGDTMEEFWALRNVSFEVTPGEVVGIIGRNGAGKSTLLKVLSRITEPSAGCVRIRGRIASLLEVGTGFHPELTGRENVFLNGAILGMSRREIKAKFDEIVAFAEVEKFLDTPVKRYSSGMYVRLAFAVAAHLEPEILVVDEVLAVGDANFQKKCLGKMKDVASHGRTVLFVSHQLGMIERLTDRSIFLKEGQVAFDGPSSEAIAKYIGAGATSAYEWQPGLQAKKTGPQFTKFFLCHEDGSPCSAPTSAGAFGVQIEYWLPDSVAHLVLSLNLLSESEYLLFATSPLDTHCEIPTQPGHYRTRVIFPRELLMPKTFSVGGTLYSHGVIYDRIMPAFGFSVEEVASLANQAYVRTAGEFQILCQWTNIEKMTQATAD